MVGASELGAHVQNSERAVCPEVLIESRSGTAIVQCSEVLIRRLSTTVVRFRFRLPSTSVLTGVTFCCRRFVSHVLSLVRYQVSRAGYQVSGINLLSLRCYKVNYSRVSSLLTIVSKR